MQTEEQNKQSILSGITNIKVPGIATMAYWSILETNDSIYFVQTGSALGLGIGTNSLLLAASVIGDIVASNQAKESVKKELGDLLQNSVVYYGISGDSLKQIKIKKGLFGGGKIEFLNGKEKSWKESGVIKLKLPRKNFRLFMAMLERKLFIK